MPPELNEEGIRIPPNNELSELDKAYIIPCFHFQQPTRLELSQLRYPLQGLQSLNPEVTNCLLSLLILPH